MKQNNKVVELDVRPQLRSKLEPFQLIMETVKTLSPDDTFILHATIKPTPLLMLMKGKGYKNAVRKLASDHWVTTFVHKSRRFPDDIEETADETLAAAIEHEHAKDDGRTQDGPMTFTLDNRGLQPPAPMIRTLKQLEKAQSGDIVNIHNDRVPMFLIEELTTLGYSYEVEEQEDGSAKVTIRKS